MTEAEADAYLKLLPEVQSRADAISAAWTPRERFLRRYGEEGVPVEHTVRHFEAEDGWRPPVLPTPILD